MSQIKLDTKIKNQSSIQPISQDDFSNMIQATMKRPYHMDDRFLLQLLWETGIQSHEILLLTRDCINTKNQFITIPVKSIRTLPLSKKCIQYFNAYMNTRKDSIQSLFIRNGKPISRYVILCKIKKYCQEAHLPYMLTPKDFRNNYALQLIENKYSAFEIQKRLGCYNLQALMRFY